MNVYDFDKTIFYPDSTAVFYKYCLKHYFWKVLPSIPGMIWQALLMLLKIDSIKHFKEKMFAFLKNIDDIDDVCNKFWDENWDRILPWYYKNKKPDDIIISASPEFNVKVAAERLGVRIIGTPMDKKTGKIHGENNNSKQKVVRFNQEFPGAKIDNFYSDSLIDTPLAKLADNAFMLDKGNISPWPWDIS